MRTIFLYSIILLLLLSCSGKDKLVVDKTPPIPPDLIPHLGDTGDGQVIYNNQTFILDDENNGLDTVPDGNWMRVSWHHFLDTDLDYVKIYRFDNFNPTPVLIDSINANRDYYLDSKQQLTTNVVYSYFIDLIDNAGNTSRSDTVSYCLLSKQILISPINEATIAPSNITLRWQRSGNVIKYRVLVFDENHNYIWHRDVNDDSTVQGGEYSVNLPFTIGQANLGKALYWRVDAFDWNNDYNMNFGSESYERIFYVSAAKK